MRLDHVARTVAWLAAANGRGPDETAVRVMKIAGETGEAVAAYIGAGRPASPPMRPRDLAALAGEVADTCQRYGVRAWSDDDRARLAAALWRFIHPDLAHGAANPYTDPDN